MIVRDCSVLTKQYSSQSISQSITFAKAPVTNDYWRCTSNLIQSIDKNPVKLAKMSISNSKQYVIIYFSFLSLH